MAFKNELIDSEIDYDLEARQCLYPEQEKICVVQSEQSYKNTQILSCNKYYLLQIYLEKEKKLLYANE